MAIAETRGPVHPAAIGRSSIAGRLADSHRRVTRRCLILGLCLLATGAWLVLAGLTLVDYLWESAWSARAAGLAIVFSAAVAGVVWMILAVRRYRLHDTAAELEWQERKYGQRLRTTLDYHAPATQPADAHPSLVKALDVETARLANEQDFEHLGPRGRMALAIAGLVGLGFVALIALAASPELRTAAGRTLLLPLEYTTVEYSPHESTIRRGESVKIEANVTGRPVERAVLRYRPAAGTGEWTEVDLKPADAGDKGQARINAGTTSETARLHAGTANLLVASIADCQEDLSFEVLAGPRTLPPGSIRVLQPLHIESNEVRVMPPEYTARPAERHDRWEFKVLEGSNVELIVRLNRAPAEALLIPQAAPDNKRDNAAAAEQGAATRAIPFAIDGPTLVARLDDLRQGGTWQLVAKAADGIDLSPRRLTIRVQPDARPTVRFLEPDEELEVTPTTDLRFAIEGGDDLGLLRVGIACQVSGQPAQTLWEQELPGDANTVRGTAELLLEEHPVTIQDNVTYYAFAEDNYFGQPRRTSTPLRFVDIRPYKRAYHMIDGGGCCSGDSVTLEELIARQRQNLSLTFGAAERRDVSFDDVERMLTNQRELLAATHEMSTGMARLGRRVPALDQAVEAMRMAAEQLMLRRLPVAVAGEQMALEQLISARRNMRQLLTSPNSQSAAACRKFDRQQRQKLRTPEEKEREREQKLAQARSQLNELARQQREWSEELQRKSGGPQREQQPDEGQKSPDQQASNQQEQQPGNSSSSPSSSQSSQSAQSSSQQSSAGQPSPSEQQAAAEAQQKLLDELREVRDQLAKLGSNSPATEAQAERAAQAMQDGLDQLQQGQPDRAADDGQRAADRLQAAADHLASMNSTDFGDRLRQAGQLAEQLASRQEQVERRIAGHDPSPGNPSPGQQSPGRQSGSGQEQGGSGQEQGGEQPEGSTGKTDGSGDDGGDQPGESAADSTGEAADSSQAGGSLSPAERADLADQERDLATRARMLDELLARLRADSLGEPGAVRDGLESLRQELPPADAAGQLQLAAEALDAAEILQAANDAQAAGETLAELAAGLRQLRGEYSQPQLDELVRLEEELAQLIDQLTRGGGERNADQLAARWDQLHARLDELAQGDPRLARALDQLRDAADPASANQASGSEAASNDANSPVRGAHAGSPQGELPPGLYWLKLGNFNGLRQVSKALQGKIQEAILAGALLDADEPVPPEYRELVEEYYRALSDDLR
jgi:hypothetical protein